MNTVIELFDVCQIENVVAGLRLLPERMIFVGFKETMTSKRKDDIAVFLKMRGIKTELSYEVVGRYNFDMIVDRLNFLTDKYPDCCFDLTGGKELVLAAMGLVASEKNIPMVQFDIKKGSFIPVRNSDRLIDYMNSELSIEESVILNGGSLLHTTPWNMSSEFQTDILTTWNVCRNNCRHWNRQANVFGSFEEFGWGGIYVDADLAFMRSKGADTYMNIDIIRELEREGLIQAFHLKQDRVTFRYKNEQIRRCLTKAGNILELYGYLSASKINSRNAGYFSDIQIGAIVDWDGKFHGYYEEEVDTTNEIDIFLMRGMVPVFVSCKNGTVHKEALYELDTVARKIGGKYAKKILLTTYISSDTNSREYILTRAGDMDIKIVEDIHKMSEEEFTTLFEKITK